MQIPEQKTARPMFRVIRYRYFDEIREYLDRYEYICSGEEITEEDEKFMDDFPFLMASVLTRRMPQMDKIAKMICIMNDNDMIKLKVE